MLLVADRAPEDAYFAEFGWVAGASGVKVPGPETPLDRDRADR